MIYVASYSADYEFTEIAHVSESLQNCVDALNKVPNFPYLGDHVTIDVWENEKSLQKVQHSGIAMYGMMNHYSTTKSP